MVVHVTNWGWKSEISSRHGREGYRNGENRPVEKDGRRMSMKSVG